MLDVICNTKKVRTHTSHLDLELFLYDQRIVNQPDQSFLWKCNQNDSMLTKSPNILPIQRYYQKYSSFISERINLAIILTLNCLVIDRRSSKEARIIYSMDFGTILNGCVLPRNNWALELEQERGRRGGSSNETGCKWLMGMDYR